MNKIYQFAEKSSFVMFDYRGYGKVLEKPQIKECTEIYLMFGDF
jgi:hypothetical protein